MPRPLPLAHPALEVPSGINHAKGRGQGLPGMLGIGQGRAEHGHHRVADEFVDHAAVGEDDVADLGKIGV